MKMNDVVILNVVVIVEGVIVEVIKRSIINIY